jgi:hypothetical protein
MAQLGPTSKSAFAPLLGQQRTSKMKRPWLDLAGAFCWASHGLAASRADVSFSNRPFGVRRFQTISAMSMSLTGLVLLFGIGTKALSTTGLLTLLGPQRLILL